MNRTFRAVGIWVVLGCLLLSGLVWSYRGVSASWELAVAEERRAAEVQRLVANVNELRQELQTAAGTSARPELSIRQKVDVATREAALAQQVLRMEQQPPQALADSPYVEHTLELELAGVTVEQTLTLAYLLSQGEDGLLVRGMNLTQPRVTQGQTLWDVQMVVGYLVYDAGSQEGTAVER